MKSSQVRTWEKSEEVSLPSQLRQSNEDPKIALTKFTIMKVNAARSGRPECKLPLSFVCRFRRTTFSSARRGDFPAVAVPTFKQLKDLSRCRFVSRGGLTLRTRPRLPRHECPRPPWNKGPSPRVKLSSPSYITLTFEFGPERRLLTVKHSFR